MTCVIAKDQKQTFDLNFYPSYKLQVFSYIEPYSEQKHI